MKRLVTVYHSHKHGVDTYFAFVKKSYVKFITYSILIQLFDLDFDPVQNSEGPESLDWEITKTKDIKTLFKPEEPLT